MRKLFLIAMLLGSILFIPCLSYSGAGQEKTVAGVATAKENVIKVTITTGGGLYGPVKSRYKVGEVIPVSISLTNTGTAPVKYCLSTSLFQNRPQLKRDGQLLPYVTKLTEMTDKEELIQRCEKSAAKQSFELQPKQTRVVDWFIFSPMGVNWYGAITAGHYEMVLQRRITCCQGPMVESDKITFEVTN